MPCPSPLLRPQVGHRCPADIPHPSTAAIDIIEYREKTDRSIIVTGQGRLDATERFGIDHFLAATAL